MLLFYTPWKHQKSFRFLNIFRGYRKATTDSNGLNGHVAFFYCTELLIFYAHFLCSSAPLVSALNTRGVYNFITKEANIPINLVPFFNDVSLLFCRFLKSWLTNELRRLFLWKSKKVRVIYSKEGKTLLFKNASLVNMYMEFYIYFGILILLNQEKVIPISYLVSFL